MSEDILRQPDVELIERLEKITARAFPLDDPTKPVLGVDDSVEVAPNLHAFFYRPDVIISTVSDGRQVVGYSAAVPIGVFDPARQDESSNTAYVYYTAIDPDFQKMGQVKEVNNGMARELISLGFGFMERDSMAVKPESGEESYSDKVARAYGVGIVTSQVHDRWNYGRQRFLRINLFKLNLG